MIIIYKDITFFTITYITWCIIKILSIVDPWERDISKYVTPITTNWKKNNYEKYLSLTLSLKNILFGALLLWCVWMKGDDGE